MAETYRPTKGMQDEAKKALGWIADGKAGSGFTDVGRKRASDIAAGRAMSADTVLRMYSFFARHEVDKKGEGFTMGDKSFPSAGRVSWAAWGGDAGYSWSTKIRNQIAKSARALILTNDSEENSMANETIEGIPDLIEELNELLADEVSFYYRAHGAHWNVMGTDFTEYHKLFLKIYEDVYESIDPTAENLRKLGAPAPFRLSEFIALTELVDANVGTDAKALATDLLAANDVVLDQLSDVFDCATANNQQGIANFIAGRIDSHQFWKWQLSASLGVNVAQPEVDLMNPDGTDSDDEEENTAMMAMSAYSEDVSEVEERAGVTTGSKVSWNTSNGMAYGKVEKVQKGGTASSSAGFNIEADAENPAYSIRIYKQKDNEWIATDVVVVHRKDILKVLTDFPASRSEETGLVIEERKVAMATAEKITMTAEVRALDTEDGSMRIGGYAATFNQEADGLNFREVIAPGAFTRALASQDPVFLLVNHDMEGIPLASTQSGTLQLRQDKQGLYMEAELDSANPRAQELASALKRGDMDKMSFAFTVAADGQTRSEGLRTLTEIDRLFEVSVVTLPAYSSTSVGMRSADETNLEIEKKKLTLKFNQYSLRQKRKG